MGFNFIVYFEKLELLAFFSGFPIIFLLVFWCFGSTKKQVLSWLPLSYALAGTLYISYVIYNGASHSLVDLSSLSLITALKTWSLFSLLFWIPFFRKRIAWPFIHSLFFLVPLLIDLFNAGSDPYAIRNDMKVYTDSLLLHAGSFLVISLAYYINSTWRRKISFRNQVFGRSRNSGLETGDPSHLSR